MRDPWAALRTCAPVWDVEHDRAQKPGRKKCRTCRELLALSEFYKGHVSKKSDCKRCYIAKVIERRQLTR